MNNKVKTTIAIGLSLFMWSGAFAFNLWQNIYPTQNTKNILNTKYSSIIGSNFSATVPTAEKTIVSAISNNINNKIDSTNTNPDNVNDIKSIFSDNSEGAIVAGILKSIKIMKPSSNNITLPINNLDVNKYRIAFYYSTITNTKLNKMSIKTIDGKTTKTTNIGTNLNLSPGQNFRIVLSPNKFKILVDGKTAFSKILSLNWKYVNLIINWNKNLIFNKTKIDYIWSDYISLKNKLINTAPLHNSDNITVNQKKDEAIWLYIAISKNDTKTINRDKSKGKFIINTNTTSQNILKLHLDPTLVNKVKNGYSIYGILKHLRTAFKWLTFKSDSINFDGNSKTKEYIYQDTGWVYYVYQLQTNTVTTWKTKTINVNFRLIYQWTTNLLDMRLTELDGNKTTKEWYYQDTSWVTILQYKWDSMRRILYAPNTKIYFANSLTKKWVQWKVLFALKLEPIIRGWKKYVTPFIELFWFDKNKQKYYVKQVKDYTSFNTFSIKLNWNYIYKKDNWIVDYSKTDSL